LVVGIVFSLVTAAPARSHFAMLIPTDSMVMQGDNRTVTLTLSFSHPFGVRRRKETGPAGFT
jgi:cobalt/nickel transport protein